MADKYREKKQVTGTNGKAEPEPATQMCNTDKLYVAAPRTDSFRTPANPCTPVLTDTFQQRRRQMKTGKTLMAIK